MTQVLRNKKFGEYEVGPLSWSNEGTHITMCPNGAYCHLSGNPVDNKRDFEKAGMRGEDLAKALEWFNNRHKAEENPVREVMLLPDGTPVFVDDRTPVENPSDLINFYGSGPAFDTAMHGLHRRKTIEASEAKIAAAKEARTGKKPPPKKTAAQKAAAKRTEVARRAAAAARTREAAPAEG